MKSIQSELERMQTFLRERIADEKYKKARPPQRGKDDGTIKTVKPKVVIGCIPHTNFSMYGAIDDRFYQAPYYLISYEKGTYSANDETVDILIQACTYTAAPYEKSDDESEDFPDNMGVLDVTEMLEKAMSWIQEGYSPSPSGMDFEIGNYGTAAYTYPFNFGYLSFQIKSTVGQSPHKDAIATF